MSLEATIAENTNAIRELIEAIANGIPTTAAQVAAVAGASAPKEKATAKKPDAKTEAASTQTTAAATAVQEPKAENSGASPALKYDEVAKAVLAVSAKHGREAALGLLKQFSLDTLKAAKPEQFADIKAAADKAL